MGNLKTETISRKELSPTSKYNYCPFCIKEAAQKGKDYTEVLKPVTLLKVLESYQVSDGSWKKVPAEYYYCSRCQRKLTVETYRVFYTAKPDGSRWTDRL